MISDSSIKIIFRKKHILWAERTATEQKMEISFYLATAFTGNVKNNIDQEHNEFFLT
jgi:hypothetical protein